MDGTAEIEYETDRADRVRSSRRDHRHGHLHGRLHRGDVSFSWPSILAVILNYVFRGDARNTYLESHFSWQIRTFWYAALFVGLTWLLSTPLLLVGVGFFVAVLGFGITGIWVGYRIFKGWLRLQDDEPMPD